MHWIAATLLSAFFLGLYDLCTKHSVRHNAVTPVFFFSTLTGALVWVALLLVQSLHPGILPPTLVTDPLTLKQHLQLLLKSTIVAASWIGTYYALKHLPLSLGAPIRATSPLLTLFGAVLFLGERPTLLETLGILTTCALACLILAIERTLVRTESVDYRIASARIGSVSPRYCVPSG